MARPINRLSARQVTTAKAGYHADGGGLYLLVSDAGTRSWVFRYQREKKAREMGLGSASVVTLQEARQAALQQRRVLAAGKDPLTERKAVRSARTRLWGEAVDAFIEARKPEWKNAEQAEQWTQSLRDYGPDRDLPMESVTTAVVLDCLRPIWTDITETAKRVQGRMARIWDAEKVAGYVAGENPAAWKGHLDHLLAKPSKVKKPKHHAAMPYGDVPAFMSRLRERENRTRTALLFTILTAARTEEVVGAPWAEFDIPKKLWTIPAGRMKGGREHQVPLSEAALAILKTRPRTAPPFALSENAMLYLVQRDPPKGYALPYTVHGFRSSFSDWAHETTSFPNEVIEMALAHTIKNKAEAAYRRGHLIDKRRELMEAWAAYLGADQTIPTANHSRGR
jgi:integrase